MRSRTTARSCSSIRRTRARARRSRRCSQGDLRSDAAQILESIYEERGDWPKLIHALEILSGAEHDLEKRVALKRKAARISSERVNDPAHAFAVLASALRDDPSLAETRDEIERIAEGSGAHDELVALYGELAASLTDALLARDYWMRIAGIDDRLGDVDRAAQAYYKVLAARSGGRRGALRARAALHAHAALAGSHRRRRAPHRADERRPRPRGPLAVTAQIYDERLGRPEDAVAAYKKVLELEPGSDRALRALDDLFTRQKMWAELAENLEAQLALAADDDAQLALMLRLSALREREMGLVDVAIEGYRQVLERAPTNAQALAALERLGQDEKYELTIADLLEPLYRHVGDWQKLIGTHEVQVRRSEDVTRRVELLHQIAQLYEDAAGELGPAFATLARALKEDPSNEATQQQLDRVARATGRFDDLASVFAELAAEIGGSGARQRALHDERARPGDGPRQRRHVDRAFPQGPRDRSAQPRGGRVARAPVPRLGAVRGAVDHPAAQVRDPRGAVREEGRALPGRDRSRRTSSTGPSRRSPSTARSSRSTPTSCGPSTRSCSATSICRGGRTCSRSTRARPTSSPTSTRRRASTTRWAPSTSASSATCRARSTRTRRSSSSTRTTCRRCRGSTCSTSAPRTGRSCSRCSRARAR